MVGCVGKFREAIGDRISKDMIIKLKKEQVRSRVYSEFISYGNLFSMVKGNLEGDRAILSPNNNYPQTSPQKDSSKMLGQKTSQGLTSNFLS